MNIPGGAGLQECRLKASLMLSTTHCTYLQPLALPSPSLLTSPPAASPWQMERRGVVGVELVNVIYVYLRARTFHVLLMAV